MSHTQNRKLAALLQGHTTDSEKLWAGPFHIPGLFRSPQCGGGAISSFLPMHPQDYQVRTASAIMTKIASVRLRMGVKILAGLVAPPSSDSYLR